MPGSLDVLSEYDGLKLIAVNKAIDAIDEWDFGESAEINLYAADAEFWSVHHDKLKSWPHDQAWTCHLESAQRYGLEFVEVNELARTDGFDLSGNAINGGGNSGFQAVNLAIAFGAARVILLGFDLMFTGGKLHWHKDHERPLRNPSEAALVNWREAFNNAPPPEGVEIWNASIHTALECYPRVELDDALVDRVCD